MWSQLVLVTDADIGELEPQAIADGLPWGSDDWPVQIAAAVRDVRLKVDLTYKDVPSASDRVVERWNLDYVLSETPARGDWTAQARDDNEDDAPIGIFFGNSANHLLVGARFEYDGVFFKVSTPNAIASVLSAEYYGAKGWTAIPVTDGTAIAGVTLAQSGRVRIAVPVDWEPARQGQSDEYLWLRFTVSQALSAMTRASQVTAIRPPIGLKRVACLLTIAYIKRGLAAQSPEPETWLQSAKEYEEKAWSLFDDLRESGIPLDINRTEAIEAETSERIDNSPVRLGRG